MPWRAQRALGALPHLLRARRHELVRAGRPRPRATAASTTASRNSSSIECSCACSSLCSMSARSSSSVSNSLASEAKSSSSSGSSFSFTSLTSTSNSASLAAQLLGVVLVGEVDLDRARLARARRRRAAPRSPRSAGRRRSRACSRAPRRPRTARRRRCPTKSTTARSPSRQRPVDALDARERLAQALELLVDRLGRAPRARACRPRAPCSSPSFAFGVTPTSIEKLQRLAGGRQLVQVELRVADRSRRPSAGSPPRTTPAASRAPPARAPPRGRRAGSPSAPAPCPCGSRGSAARARAARAVRCTRDSISSLGTSASRRTRESGSSVTFVLTAMASNGSLRARRVRLPGRERYSARGRRPADRVARAASPRSCSTSCAASGALLRRARARRRGAPGDGPVSAPTAFVTGGSGLHRRPADPPPGRGRLDACARSRARPPRRRRCAARGRRAGARATSTTSTRCAPAPRAPSTPSTPRRTSASGARREEFERVQRRRHAQRARRLPRARACGASCTSAPRPALLAGEPLVNVERGRAAAPRLEGALLRPPRRWPSRSCATRTATASRRSSCGRGSSGVAGDTTILPALAEAVEKRAASPGSAAAATAPRRRTSTTSIHGLVLGAERGRPGGVYFVTDGEPVVFREFITELLGTQGVEAPATATCRRRSPARSRPAREGVWRTLPPRRAARRSRGSPTGSRRRSARSTSRVRAPSSATSRCARSRTGMEELRGARAGRSAALVAVGVGADASRAPLEPPRQLAYAASSRARAWPSRSTRRAGRSPSRP